jgi:hypothetical protein
MEEVQLRNSISRPWKITVKETDRNSVLLCLFVGYLSTVSVPQALWRRVVLWLVDNGLDKNLKQSGFGLFEELFWHSLGRTGENRKN